MMQTTGACAGIDNYSRHLTGRKPGEPPPTRFEYLPEDAILIVDESHVTVPPIGGTFTRYYARESPPAQYGFRAPCGIGNGTLKLPEWAAPRKPAVLVAAQQGPWELERLGRYVSTPAVRAPGLQ